VAIEPRHVALEPAVAAAASEAIAPVVSVAAGQGLKETTEEFQRRWLEACIARNGGHLSRAAAEAGMDRSNFHRLARRLGVIAAGG
jgi:anaerobic nitric oxide reductase transcription regulator